jgi:hypothetical protein
MKPNSFTVPAGRILSGLVTGALLADAGVHLLAPNLVRPLMEASGFAVEQATLLGLIILTCAVFYAVPMTAVLGAILVTGFVGGAICTHVRLGEFGSPPQIVALATGVAAWAGLYLRDPRLRELLPRSSPLGGSTETRPSWSADQPIGAA